MWNYWIYRVCVIHVFNNIIKMIRLIILVNAAWLLTRVSKNNTNIKYIFLR